MLSKAERLRLKMTHENTGWKKWGPYLSERQWGTVREDYSANGDAWNYVDFEMSRSYAYRWGEDGIGGLSDNKQNLCLAFAFWNGKDRILKERLFGLSNGQGNHGEDVKEIYYYLDSTPTHSYMKMLYKYPQQAFPYEKLKEANRFRSKQEEEYELMDTGIFEKDEYFDIFIEYAKASEEDILIKVTAHNRSNETVPLYIIPQIWFRNIWSWGNNEPKPVLYGGEGYPIVLENHYVGNFNLYYYGKPELMFCDNETNPLMYGKKPEENKFYKDGINNYIINGDKSALNPEMTGTKAGLKYIFNLKGGESATVMLRLCKKLNQMPFDNIERVFSLRKQEADDFYADLQKNIYDEDLKNIQRQAYAGMMWCKQYYYYNVEQWLDGDPSMKDLPKNRKKNRNSKWRHLSNSNLISMPDKWEYPWYAAWDLAFHCVPLAKIDAEFAKRQLLLLLREYYMHPNGQIPAYEWSFSDVNPPVHAWGAWQVYSIDKEANNGVGDTDFLAKVFLKLLMNFTWWINQKDVDENNLFDGGFLGLDNIGVFDRSQPMPMGGKMEQADATSWMAMYALNMLRIAIELSKVKHYYQETASKFFEHFLNIASALFHIGDEGVSMWDDEDEFYYDIIHFPNESSILLKVRSLVGLLPLFAVEVFSRDLLRNNPDFLRRIEHAFRNRKDLTDKISRWFELGKNETRMLSLVRVHRMKCILKRMLDESEFLSKYGIRALSRYHHKRPYQLMVHGNVYSVKYIPGESDSGMFGGNSNWRGPIWFPVNFMLILSLLKFDKFYGDEVKLEYPTGSGELKSLKEIALAIANRLIDIFRKDENGKRVVFGEDTKFSNDEHFKDYILFYEYFHGDTGKGLGASHQTGWTGLVATLIDIVSEKDYTPLTHSEA
jgi:hypothetical protein